jgi:hypothetical protein
MRSLAIYVPLAGGLLLLAEDLPPEGGLILPPKGGSHKDRGEGSLLPLDLLLMV